MSNCLDYMRLHQRYADALRSWIQATRSSGTAEGKEAQEERDATFRALSDHQANCRRCENKAP
jgi:hypothetical protein